MADETSKKRELLEFMESRGLSADDIAFLCEYTADNINFLTGHTPRTSDAHEGADQAGYPGRSVAGLMFGHPRYRAILAKMDEGQNPLDGTKVGIRMYATDLVTNPRIMLDLGRENSLDAAVRAFAFSPLENWEYGFQQYVVPRGATEESRKATADMVMEHLEECVAESLKTQKMNLLLPYDKVLEAMVDSYPPLFEKVRKELELDFSKSDELNKVARDFANAVLLRIKPDTKEALEYFTQLRSRVSRKAEDFDYEKCKRAYIDVLASNGMDKNTALVVAQQFEKKFEANLKALGIDGSAPRLQ